MANLLPLTEKKNIRREYRARIGIVFLLLLSTLIIIATISLIPLYISSSYKLNDILAQIEDEKQNSFREDDKQDPIKITQDANAKLLVLRKKDSILPLSSELTTIIVGYKPSDVKIDAILYDRGLSDGKITLNGIARNRETLLSFLKSLERESMFKKVNLPISSFVKETDIKFSIRITIELENEKNNEI